ncbi:YadA C-terminal domain-containing protein [Enterobacter hormaechei]
MPQPIAQKAPPAPTVAAPAAPVPTVDAQAYRAVIVADQAKAMQQTPAAPAATAPVAAPAPQQAAPAAQQQVAVKPAAPKAKPSVAPVVNNATISNSQVSSFNVAVIDARIAETKAAQAKTNKNVAQNSRQLANHERRISELESSNNAQFKSLKGQIDDNKKSADAGIAGVAAMSNIPQVTESQTFNVGAGVGARGDQQAMAVGFSARATQSVVVKASVAADTNSEWTVGAGVAIGW